MWSEAILDRSTPLRLKGRGRARARWTTLDWAASFTLSTLWHLMVLAVFALAIHPFQLPDLERAVNLELLPPLPALTPPPTPTVRLDLRPREKEPAPAAPPAPAPEQSKPEQIQPEPVPPQPQPEPQTAQPEAQVLPRPVEVKPQRAAPAPLQAPQAAPQIPQAPPEPVTVTRPAPLLRPQLEAPRAQVPSRAGPIAAPQAAPAIPQAAPAAPAVPQAAPAAPAVPEAAPAAPEQSAAPQVLTNQTVVQSPVEIRPRQRPAPINPGVTPEGGAPSIPGGAAAPPAGGGAAGGGGAKAGPGPIDGINGGYGLKGLRSTLGCENPDAYKLSPEDRAICLERFARRGGPELGPNIPAAKLAEFDRIAACRRATVSKEVPAYGSETPGNKLIPGLGATPSLRDCPPGDR